VGVTGAVVNKQMPVEDFQLSIFMRQKQMTFKTQSVLPCAKTDLW